jgi:hypothetical protein
MPKAAKQDVTDVRSTEGYEGRYADLGGFTVGFETYKADADIADFFRGLPDDACQCPHWGVVVKGTVTYRTADGEMNVGPGEAYYVPPGHVPFLHGGTEVIEFSPTDALQQTMNDIARNMAARHEGG